MMIAAPDMAFPRLIILVFGYYRHLLLYYYYLLLLKEVLEQVGQFIHLYHQLISIQVGRLI
jgi:hypothetical protein